MPFGQQPILPNISGPPGNNVDRLRQSQRDRQRERRQAVARFVGGPWHGQDMAIPEHGGVVEVARPAGPVNPIYWDGTASTQSFQQELGLYYISNDWSTTATTYNTVINWIADNTTDTRIYNWGGSWTAYAYPAPAPLTQEEADRRLAATRASQHKSAIRRKKAIKKGRKLLLEVLTDEQMVEYARTKSFTVHGADGKIYKVRKSGTTHQMVDGVAAYSHCIHLPYSYIDEDTLVAVKLLLETDPPTFHKIANTSKLAPPPAPVIQIAQPHEVAAEIAIAA